MSAEPEVDAFLVEDVVADRQEAEEAVVLELQQADRAFQRRILVLFVKFAHGGVGERREDSEEQGIEAARRRLSGVRGVQAVDEIVGGGAVEGPGVEGVHEATSAQVDHAEPEEEADEDAEAEGDDHRRGGVHRRRRRIRGGGGGRRIGIVWGYKRRHTFKWN